MNTVLTSSPEKAAAFIRAGDVVAFPTETVYGLGADSFNPDAVEKIFEAKGRPQDNPLIVHVANLGQIEGLAADVTDTAWRLIDRFFPGPLTIILRRHPDVPSIVTAGLDTVGIRMPSHPVAQEFLTACDTPVAAPSANLSGRPSPTSWQTVHANLNGRISCILKGGRTDVGIESTVLDCSRRTPMVLRAGGVTLEDLQEIVPRTRMADEIPDRPLSPGQVHRHYVPNASVQLVSHPSEAQPSASAAFIGLDAPSNGAAFGLTRMCESKEAYAHELFDFFYECDRLEMETIYCQKVDEKGLGRGLMDRLLRAAQR